MNKILSTTGYLICQLNIQFKYQELAKITPNRGTIQGTEAVFLFNELRAVSTRDRGTLKKCTI